MRETERSQMDGLRRIKPVLDSASFENTTRIPSRMILFNIRTNSKI